MRRTISRGCWRKRGEKYLGEPIRVNNKFAGGGTEGYRYAKDAKLDGRTIIWNATALLTLYHVGKLDFDH